MVLLPDHLHMCMTLPERDADFSRRLALIKRRFTSDFIAAGGAEQPVTGDQTRQRRRGIWQPRFYEHTIRDELDLNRHLDYIHYNPVKHGLAACPHGWEHSTFHNWVDRNGYDADWLCTCCAAPRGMAGNSLPYECFVSLPRPGINTSPESNCDGPSECRR